MNLLDQLANFCPTPVSINLLEPLHTEGREGPRTTRHHSVFAISNCDTRHSKSIEKLQSWTPSNKNQQRKKVLFKLFGTLSNKARKLFFTFWVNCEQAIKNKKQQISKEESRILGSEKIIGFIQTYEAKRSQIVDLSKAFSKIVKHSFLQQVRNCLQRALQPPLRRLERNFMQAINENENLHLKMDIFINSLKVVQSRTIKQKFMSALIKNYSQSTLKAQEDAAKPQVSRNIFICSAGLKNRPIFLNQEKCLERIETAESNSKMFGKMPIDKATENCPEICDSNLLFIQQPITETRSTIQNIQKTISTEPSLQRIGLKTRKSASRLQLQSHSQFLNTSKKQINLTQSHFPSKTQQSTPKCRSISSSSIFNVDQSRMEKLQNKLFGNTMKSQSRFSVNGQDWKSDRKVLEQIIYSIKSPEKVRRNSAYELQLGQLYEKMEFYKGRAVKENIKPKTLNFDESQYQLRDSKSSIMKGVVEKDKINTSKVDQKILISLKLRKKDSSGIIGGSSKSEQWEKLYQEQKSGKKFAQGGRK